MIFDEFQYIPIISVRPSEHLAYTMLPGATKDKMLPIFQIQKWVSSKKFENTVTKIAEMSEYRWYIADVRPPLELKSPADQFVADLVSPSSGFRNWVEFISANPLAIPTLQIGGTAQDILSQMQAFAALKRGVVIRLRRSEGKWQSEQYAPLRHADFSGVQVLIVVDCGQILAREDVTLLASQAVSALSETAKYVQGADIAVCFSASSFPGDFKSIHPEFSALEIREREFHRVCRTSLVVASMAVPVLYGDYGSVCLLKRGGGGQGPSPRVDYPTGPKWYYQRREVDPSNEKFKSSALCYIAAANAISSGDMWNDELIIWGANRIRQAALGDLSDLESPQRWTAVRINIHFYQQTYYDGVPPPSSEDEWKD